MADKRLLKFVEAGTSPSGKTMLWQVGLNSESVTDRFVLGQVRWYAPWRRYCFYPADGTIFDASCLREIVEWCADRTNEAKEKWG